MDVSYRTILQKMEAEVQKAKANPTNREMLLRRIAKVQMLCDLLLEESTDQSSMLTDTTKPSQKELAWMMEGTTDVDTEEKVTHDPKSIFDF